MTKTAIGSLANASAAVALVARCRALLLVEVGAGDGLTFGPTSADRWRTRVAADGAPFTFSFLLGNYVAVKHNTDLVIYKCLNDPTATAGYVAEKAAFDAANTAGRTWCPDYWYYDAAPNVMALREYTLAATAGSRYNQSGAVGFLWGAGVAFPATAETTDMVAAGVKPSNYTIATNPATGKYVCIDAST